MKKGWMILILVVVFGLIGGGGYFYLKSNPQKEEKQEQKKEETVDVVLERFNKMTLEEKIGQMIFIAHRDTDYDEGFIDEFKTYQPGGFILFKENITSFKEVKAFNERLQSLSKIPLFIGTDQEGGRVQRFKSMPDKNFTIIPPMQEVGAKNDAILTEKIGQILGSELQTLGINVDFAPDIDINSNPLNTVIGDRSFSSSKETVATMAASLAKGLKATGVIPVYKHFPGHGDTYEDSHQDFAYIHKTKEELMDVELYPFSQIAKETDAMIMAGHLSLPNLLEDDTPASLSPTIINILREELGYKGIIITDALDMGALTNHYEEEEIVIQAVNAGCDILLMPQSIQNTISILKKAVQDGTVQEERINEAVLKILRMKEKYQLFKSTKAKDLTEEEWTSHQEFIEANF